jgi:RND family efflux transporter MFP subunit
VRSVKVMAVEARSAGRQALFAAEIRPRIEARLGFRVGGKLVRRLVEVGSPVRAGQVLAQLDPEDLKLADQAQQAALRSAQAHLDQVSADNRRVHELHDKGFVSAAELQRSDTALKSAQAQLESARAQSGLQSHQAGYASLVADAAGVVTAIEAEPGQVLAAGAAVIRLALDRGRDVVFSVPEDQVTALSGRQGKAGTLQMRLWGEEAWQPVTVREVAAAADPVTRTFLVRADLGRSPARLGQSATVRLSASGAEPVIHVPLSALSRQAERTQVWVLDESAMVVHARPVELDGVDGEQARIRSGLQPGQLVVTAGVHVLTEGQAVRRWQDPARAAGAASAASR